MMRAQLWTNFRKGPPRSQSKSETLMEETWDRVKKLEICLQTLKQETFDNSTFKLNFLIIYSYFIYNVCRHTRIN